MAFVTADALTCGMVAVTEDRLKTVVRLQRPVIRCKLMTDIARTDLALRRVTGKTIIVRVDARLDRLARSRRGMARSAPGRWTPFAAGVSGVVKFHVKALNKFCRKGLNGRRVGLELFMTDRTHCTILIGRFICNELVQMTADARIVAGVIEFFAIALAAVARHAVKLLVLGDLVVKSGKIRC